MENAPLLMTVDEAASRLHMNRTAVYRAIGSGDLRSVKYGRMRRISLRALEDFISRVEGRALQMAEEMR